MSNQRKPVFISILIATGPGRKKKLLRCIQSILKSSTNDYEILLTDNSGDPTLKMYVSSHFPLVRTIVMHRNVGVQALNVGCANALHPYILILDDDAEIQTNTISLIQKAIISHKIPIGAMGLNSLNPNSKQYYHQNMLHNNHNTIFTQTVGGTVFSKEAIQKAGYYDDRFFLWMHENDLLLRIRNLKYDIVFSKEILIYHTDQWQSHRLQMFYNYFRNSLWMFFKLFSWHMILLLSLRLVVSLVIIPFKKKSFHVGMASFAGFIVGVTTGFMMFKDKTPLLENVQKQYLYFYLFDIYPSCQS